MDKKYDEKSCGIVTFREIGEEREYLILKYPGGHFDFPKGHVENEETEHETAYRELVEETAIEDIVFVEGYRKEIFYKYNKKGTPSTKLVVFFLGKTETKECTMSHEHLDYYWLTYNEAYDKATFDNAKNLLKEAEKLLEIKK